MNKEYKIKLDLNKKLYNKKMAFNQFDENVNDFYIEITKNNEIVKDLDKAIVVLAVIKPNKEVDSQFVEVENGLVYADLKPSMKDEIGIYTARAMLILEDERVVTDVISYEVEEDKIFSLLNDTVETTEEFTLLTDMLSRLSTIELNENNREETFNNIKDEFEIIKNNHNELVTAKTDNKVTELLGPVVSKANEKINEVDNKIVDIENAISEADSKIDNAIAKIPPKSELIGEKGDKGEKGEKGDKGDRGEQGLQGIQGIQGIQGERGLQGVKGDKGDKGEQGIQGLKGDKGDKGDRGEQGVKGDTPSITHLETSINNKIQEVETRFNTLTSTQQQDAEVIDARDGETSLKARLDRDIEKAKQVYVNVEGSNISTDSSSGYLKDVEILGNTVQDASNLADIRSVGDKVEGQELYEIPVVSCSKNLFNSELEVGDVLDSNGSYPSYDVDIVRTKDLIKVNSNTNYYYTFILPYESNFDAFYEYDNSKNFIRKIPIVSKCMFTTSENGHYISLKIQNELNINAKIQIEEGTQATPYEPYIGDKITILSPVQLEKVGDVRDRIIEKDGVWGVEKNVTISVDENNVLVNTKTDSEFIPLPHDQQIKLRTFANKTNISFLTEIEGTIKAQVPKSLGATVNTHTEQISNLNKELDRVKKLEESTVSTVTTESDFTTVEATSNGYFEDVKLEGKTLVNLATQPTNNGSINHQYATISTVTNIKPSTEYTYIIRNNGRETLKLYLNNNGGFDWRDLDVGVNSTVIGKAKTLPTIEGDIWLSLREAETVEQNLQVVLLEGDHTQNPPSYFEGLKSVGDGVDEIVVSSVKGDGNLFDVEAIYNTQEMVSPYKWYVFKGKPNTNYTISSSLDKNARVNMFFKITNYDYTQTLAWLCHTSIANVVEYKTFTTDSQGRIGIAFNDVAFSNVPDVSMFTTLSSFSIYEGNATKAYTPHQSDKKRLLYYNKETQTWEKPILREWDSIEKHADGKYYYHQRSGEVVLNGSENWINPSWTENDTIAFSYSLQVKPNGEIAICDKFNVVSNGLSTQTVECCQIVSNTSIGIRVFKSKLPTQDVQGFKQWLQANNVTAVYQLAEEKVYECTNIDLITYANETNYIVESGAIVPKSTLKVHNNISNVVSLLQKKVSLLESNITKYMITQNRMQLASTYSADSVTFKVDYAVCSENMSQENYDTDLYNLILNNILVGKDNYDYDHMFNIIMDYASWSQISWDQFDILVGLMDIQHNPPIEEIPTDDEIVEEIPNEIM